ncbi:MAG: membrane protein insertase YidC [Opitutales bacterium]|nr:membrane protein insertase YidC [Opitutales bacterium]
MDFKNTFIGILFLAAAGYVMYTSHNQQAQIQSSQEYTRAVAAQEAAPAPAAEAQPATDEALAATKDDAKEELCFLENEYMKIAFTNKGGAIKDVKLFKFKEAQNSQEPYIFNDGGKVPAMALAFSANAKGAPQIFEKTFSLKTATKNLVEYEYSDESVRIVRIFTLEETSSKGFIPYVINTATVVENKGAAALPGRKIYVSLGMEAPNAGDVYGSNLAFGLYDGDDADFVKSSRFVDSSGFLGIGASKAKSISVLDNSGIVWGAIKNQFFATIFTPAIKGEGGVALPVSINPEAESKYMKNGLAGFMGFEADKIEPKQSFKLEGTFYVGPKDLSNLVDLGKDQDLVMDYGWAAFISKPLSILLSLLNSVFAKIAPNWSWGWAIIMLTIIVRACLWPLTAVQIRSSLKMSKLQGPIAELRKKYANDQQKLSQETMKLYSEYGINPLAGCFPLLIQLPIFLGLYYMLQSSSGIRFAHFLWIKDLSLPDYIPGIETVFGFPLHPLPIINAIITYLQMQITPMATAEKSQAIMIKLMPFIMLFFFYTFPSGLVLYWTMQSLIGVVQAIIINKKRDTFELKKRDRSKPSFMERVAAAAQEEAKRREAQRSEMLRGTMHDTRKKNPGGRSTPPKRK